MTTKIQEAHSALVDYGIVGGILSLGDYKLQPWQVAPQLQRLQNMIQLLQDAESEYHSMVAQRDAVTSTLAVEQDRPMREIRNLPAPDPYTPIKIKHDSAIGYCWINSKDYNPSTMELIQNA